MCSSNKFTAWVAQLVEQETENLRVGGSIPSPGTSLCVVPKEVKKPIGSLAGSTGDASLGSQMTSSF